MSASPPPLSFEPVRAALSTLRACETPEHAMWAMCRRKTVDACVRFLVDVRTVTTVPDALDATPTTARLLLTALLVHAHPSFLDDASGREAPDGCDADRAHSPTAVRQALAQSVAADAERFVETVANQHPTACARALVAFRASFEAWKRADREALLDVLVASYVNLAASVAEMDAVAAAAETEAETEAAAETAAEAATEAAADTAEETVVATKTEEETTCGETTDTAPSPTTLRESLHASMCGLEAKAAKLGVSATAFRTRVAAATPLPTSSSDEEEDNPNADAWAEAVATVASTCERAFWDAFTAKLQAGDLTPLRTQLDEVVAKLKALTPRRTDLHATLDQAIDVDLVVQMAEHDALDAPTFDVLVDTLVDTLVSLQAPAATPATRAWVAAWRAQCTGAEYTYATLLPPFFAALHRDIDAASDACAILRATLK